MRVTDPPVDLIVFPIATLSSVPDSGGYFGGGLTQCGLSAGDSLSMITSVESQHQLAGRCQLEILTA